MSKVNSFLANRLKSATKTLSKMTSLADLSSNGQLSSFSGVFQTSPLTDKEQDVLKGILTDFSSEINDIQKDLEDLSGITSEVKAINNQAAILHGERIKKAQTILKQYRDGAFTAWLIATYGNRQTPYNLLQYYEFHTAIPKQLQEKLYEMPRQAIYTLASRSGPQELKEEIIKNYKGEPKQEILQLIRNQFPLAAEDKRMRDLSSYTINMLERLKNSLNSRNFNPTEPQKKKILSLLQSLEKSVS
jgi:Uncharacterised protein family (UPF0137)